jgi:hypothetical protein
MARALPRTSARFGNGLPRFDGHESRDWTPALGDHNLASLSDIVQKTSQFLADLTDTCRAHTCMVSHVGMPEMPWMSSTLARHCTLNVWLAS